MGTSAQPEQTLLLESAFYGSTAIYYMVDNCTAFGALDGLVQQLAPGASIQCTDMPFRPRAGAADLNSLLYSGYAGAASNAGHRSRDITAAYDFGNTSVAARRLQLVVYFNSTYGQARAWQGQPIVCFFLRKKKALISHSLIRNTAP